MNASFSTRYLAMVSLRIVFEFLNGEGKTERQVMPLLALLIKFVLLLIIFHVSFCWSPTGDFGQNFGCQIFFPLAMATKMIAAWSAVRVPCFCPLLIYWIC